MCRSSTNPNPAIPPRIMPSARLRFQFGETGCVGVSAACTGTIRITLSPALLPDGVSVSSATASADVARMAASAMSRASSGDDAVAVIWKMTVPSMLPSSAPLTAAGDSRSRSRATLSATFWLSTSGR